ncbi:MAG: HRDC domain-containing protein, partial [Chloroflexi bacterium]|nr:HRDC domain-containing protein [Chloroflexota bacterium]
AEPYHAGLDRDLRTAVQRRFTVGETPVIVATNAFGMGIDKPDVRYVVHVNMPGRLEAYTQEAGRAGRDGDPAECTLLYARSDRRFQQRFIDDAHPTDEAVRATWQRWTAMADVDSGRLPFGLADDDPGYAMIVAALRQSRLLDPVALRITSTREDVPIDTSSIVQHREYVEARLREMAEYAETTACRRAVILQYFGEEAESQCDHCDNCLGRHSTERTDDYPDDLYEAILAMRERIARQSDRDPYLVFENRTAREVATYRPTTAEALQTIWGIGATRASWFGNELTALVAEWEEAHPDAPPPARAPAPARMPTSRVSRAAQSDATVRSADVYVDPADPLYLALRTWRTERARADNLPAYTVFSDRTLRELVATRPRNVHALLRIWGLGESRVERFGAELVGVIRTHESAPAAST